MNPPDEPSEKVTVIETTPSRTEPYKQYRERWAMLLIFMMNSASNSMQWTQLTMIGEPVMKYYNIDLDLLTWTSLVYMAIYPILLFPACWVLDNFGLRVYTTVGAFGTCAGSWMKANAISRNSFTLVFAGQVLAAIGQVFLLNVPPRLAAVWFGPNQVSMACSLGVVGNEIGVALGFILPPLLVRPTGTMDQIGGDLKWMFELTAIITTVFFVLHQLFFHESPITPPSSAADYSCSLEIHFLTSFKKLFSNFNYVLLVLSYGLCLGVFYAVSTFLSVLILIHFPGEDASAGRIGLVLILSGIVGCIIAGVFLDKTRRFKETTLVVYAGCALSMLFFTLALHSQIMFLVYVSGLLFGLFITAYMAVGYEFGSEITYPEPDGTASGILNAVVQVVGIVLTLTFENMLSAVGDLWTNLTMVFFFVIGNVMTVFIKSDLRRQGANAGIFP